MQINKLPPQSVFNTQHSGMMQLLQRLNQESDEQVSLHSHQVEAVLRLKDYFDHPQNRNSIALIVLPTGCGKTGVAVLGSYALKPSRVLVITPSIIISRQICEAYDCFLIDRGIISKKETQDVLPTISLITHSSQIKEGMRSMVMVVNAHKIGGQSNVGIEDIPRGGYDLVIVDEAHHYPAPTWKLLVDHFSDSRRLFLTATPEHGGQPILPDINPCYRLTQADAITRGIIREVKFDDRTPQGNDEESRNKGIARCIEKYLNEDDQADPTVKHQGMVLTQTKQALNAAEKFCNVYNDLYPNSCAVYVSDTGKHILDAFKAGQIRTLVIIGRLLEGFDHKPVSVLGIVRNIAPTSRVLFAQFVGRAVRKTSRNDPVCARIVTHKHFRQQQNFEAFENLPERDEDVDPTDAHM